MSLSPHARSIKRTAAWQIPIRLARYRYRLGFEINPAGTGRLLFVGLNPSTASLTKHDPTVDTFCRGFATRNGFRELEVVNLFALRSTDKSELLRVADPMGPDNDVHIAAAARRADRVLLGWGAPFHELIASRAGAVLALLQSAAPGRLCILATTADGSPRHPLYQPLSRPLRPIDTLLIRRKPARPDRRSRH